MARYLVTGGAGFIGGYIARALERAGHTITVVDDLSSGLERNIPEGATFVRGDLRDDATIAALPSSVDAVLHLAAQPSAEISHDDPLRDFDVNARGTLRLLQWAEHQGITRFLHASSMAVYGATDGIAREDTPLRPGSFYGAGKVAAEAYVSLFARRGMRTTSFRMFNVYGSGQDLANMRQGMASIYMAFLLRGEPVVVKGSLDRFRDLVHVSDVADAWIRSIDDSRADGKIYNVGTGRKSTVADMLDALGRAFGYGKGQCPATVVAGTAGDIHGNVADISAIRGDLGWEPATTLEAGIAEMAAWAKAETGKA